MGGITPILTAKNLSIGHAGKVLVAGIDLTLEPGEITCLLGPNGVGKTTLFRTLLGLLPPVEGSIELGSTPLASLNRGQIAKRIALVPQGLVTPFAWSALDLVLMGASAGLGPFAQPGAAERAYAMAALDRLGIETLADQDITRLSGGQRQMVLIARALAQGAQAIIMDEPTASLDFANRFRIENVIRDLTQRGVAILLSTHDPDQAARLAEKAILIAAEGVLAQGLVTEVMTAVTLSRLYNIPIRAENLSDGQVFLATQTSTMVPK